MAEAMYTQFEDKEVRDFLKGMDKKLKDVKDGRKKYAGLLSVIVFQDVNDHFDKQQGSAGRWAPWSNMYRSQLEAEGRAGNKILQYSGRLRQNFKPTDFKNQSNGILWFNDAQTKSGYPYAAGHDKGTAAGSKQRDFMWLSDKAMDKIGEQTLQFMLDEGVQYLATRVDLNGILDRIQTLLTEANTTTASPINLSADLLNGKVVKQILKVNPEMIIPQASIFPLVTSYIPAKDIIGQDIAKDQLSAKRRSTLNVNVVGTIWNNNIRDFKEDPADTDIHYLMENIELVLRSDPSLNNLVKWQKPVSCKYYTSLLDEQTHLRSGLLSLECELFYQE